MGPEWLRYLAIGVGIVAVALLVLIVMAIRNDRRGASGRHARTRPPRDSFRQVDDEPPAPPKRAAIVVNPTKVDSVDDLRASLTALMAAQDWAEPLVLETTAEDPGLGQTRAALEEGVDLVCAMGGDGTVRAVAEVLSGTTIPMGLLPAGTGNLLARNLGLPVDDLDEALAVALTGRERTIDVGIVRTDADDEDQVFLVMVGMGLDAEAMAGADEKVKKVIGWVAYLLSGAKALAKRGFAVRVGAGDNDRHRTQHARTVVVGNCGTIQGGLELMPDAKVDDGVLDAMILAPRGVFGWAAVVTDIVTRHRRGHSRLQRLESETITVTTRQPVEAQLDGDAVGPRRQLTCRVQPGALVVRVQADAEA